MFIMDAHCDTLCDIADGRRTLSSDKRLGQLDILRMKEVGISSQIFAVYIEDKYAKMRANNRALQMIQAFLKEIDENPADLAHIKNAGEVEKAVEQGKIAALLSIEGGEALGGDLFMLDLFYRLGVRLMGLTWNRRNEIADGAGEGETGGGLTTFGKEVVARMNELGMVVDVSHISEAGFWSVMEMTKVPVIASHSNCKKIAGHRRNLTDEQIKVIYASGGVIGVTFVKPFIGAEKSNLEGLLDHIDHMANLIGTDGICIGSDFDGVTEELIPDGMGDVWTIPKLINGLNYRGYADEDIEKIMGKNLLKTVEKVMSLKW